MKLKLHKLYFQLIFISLISVTTLTALYARPGCNVTCGNTLIPYPFGIGPACYHNEWYAVDCRSSTAYLSAINNQEIFALSLENQTLTVNVFMTFDCQYTVRNSSQILSVDLQGSPFLFSQKHNRFTVEGCGNAVILDQENLLTGCSTICQNGKVNLTNNCYGINCCQTTIPYYLETYSVNTSGLQRQSADGACGSAFLVDEQLSAARRSSGRQSVVVDSYVPISLSWRLIEGDISGTNCSSRGEDLLLGNGTRLESYKCSCSPDELGNPYLSNGCEPKVVSITPCQYCDDGCNFNGGNYNCDSGQRRPLYPGPLYPAYRGKLSMLVPILALSLILGVILTPSILSLYKLIQKTKDKRRKERFFKRNGGLLLKQQESANDGLVDKTKLFTAKELEKATDYFNENRILGRGGQGTVYKGMLTDGKIVAIKKSKIVDESQLEQFINEVVILSQVNHRNVVKLLGCCLETEVPLLVSEFISNGTLYEKIHDDSNEFPLTLKTRLRISTEIAGALAYLHSATSIPIYHRDIKSTNILLDDKHRAKVSDFGTSRFVSVDQTHLTTLVKGTFGYLDPEYFQSGRFTEKSDVYSFGVVLVELLTGEKPISLTTSGEHRSLAAHFRMAMEEGKVMSIIDSRIISEGSRGELMAIANLAMQCLNLNGKIRPTMKEVASELESIRTSHIPSTVPNYRKPKYNSGEEEMILFSFDYSAL